MKKPSSAPSNDTALLAPFWKENVERYVLPNGLTLIVKPDHSAALASVQVWVKTGSMHEDRCLGAGVSHFLEHMLFKGTETREGREISAQVQAHGGYINAYTTFDRTVYYIDLPSEHAPFAMEVLADAVYHSKLPADEVLKERDVILREIAMTRDDPDQRLSEALFETAFRAHPYRHPIIGYKDLFSGLTRDDLVAYYKARYVPNNTVVVVVGAVDALKIKQEAELRFGSVPRARLSPVLVPDEPVQLASRSAQLWEDVELTRAGLAWQIPGFTHEDAPCLDLMSVVLGAGESSILWQEIREKARLVHSIDAHCWNPGSVGLFYISLTCDPDKRVAAIAAIQRQLALVAKKGCSAAVIKKAIRQLVVGEINTRKTMSGQASRLGAAEVVAGDLRFSQSYFERLGRLTSADLKRAAKQYFLSSSCTEVSSNPLAAAPKVSTKEGTLQAEDKIELVTLPNGGRILLLEDARLPLVHLRVLAHGGPMHEDAGKIGASSLLATLLTKDTQRHSSAEVASFIESVGGSFYPFSGNNSLGFSVEVLPTDTDKALRVLREALLLPAFKKSTFEMEREAQVADLRLDADDVVSCGRKLARAKFFGDYALALDAQGDEACLNSLRVADVASLYRRFFTGPNVVLAVVGHFERKSLLPQLKKIMSDLPKGKALALPGPHRPPTAAEWTELQPREQAVLFQTYPGPCLLVKDFFTGEVADELFSGMASRLFERVREEKGLAYFVRSSRVTGLGAGMFYFYAGTAPDKVDEVFAEIEAEVQRVIAGAVEQAELERCHARLKAARRQSLQTSGAKAMNAGLNALFGIPLNDWKEYDSRISAVTVQDLANFAQRYFKSELRTRVVVKPKP